MTDLGARRWWALIAVSLSVLTVGLDGTVLSVALPTLSSALHATESDLQWFSSGYFLVLAAAMLPAGLLGDRFGRKKVLLASLALFGIGSAISAYSTSAAEFLASRILLGLAGGGIIVMAIASLTVLFSQEERPKAVGVWAAANFLALPLGPILGGWLLSHYWWGWVFLLNVPVAVLGLVAVTTLVPESRATTRPGLDPVGTVISVAGLVAVVYGLIKAGEDGWSSAAALALILGGLVILVGFYGWERRLSHQPDGQPLLDLTLFRSASFTWGVVLAAVGVMSMIGVMFTMPQFFQGVLGTDAMGSGLRLLPLIGGLVVGAVPADRVVAAVGAKVTAATGFTLLAIGLFIGATTAVRSTGVFTGAWMAIVGLGTGLAMATATSAALMELSAERSGVASAVLQAVNKVGGPFGTAILGSVLSAGYLARLHTTALPSSVAAVARQSVFGGVAVAQRSGSASLLANVQAAFVHGMDVALVVSGGIAAVGAVLTVVFLPGVRAAVGAKPPKQADQRRRDDVIETR